LAVNVTGLPTAVVDGGAEVTLTPMQGVTAAVVLSVYWLELYASHVPAPFPEVPELLASRVQTDQP
jgi:hypothetical protein